MAWEQSLEAGREEKREEVEKVEKEEKHILEELGFLGTADSIPAEFIYFYIHIRMWSPINTYVGPSLICQ